MSMGSNSTAPFPTGWVHDPIGVKRVLRSLPLPLFGAGAPHLMGAAPTDVLLYKAWADVNGSYPDYPAQQIGDCTSFGTGHGVDLLACVQIAIGNRAETWKEACTEALYGEGRELANMLGGGGDGCYGAAVAKAANQFGVTTREVVGPYSGQRAKQWGDRGVPSDVKVQGKDHTVRTVSLVSTWDELQAALANGYPVTVCSNQGFAMTRDARGICRPSGSWGHCMLICGIMYAGTSDECAVIANSWGNTAFSGPTPNDMPSFAFGAERPVVEGMLGVGDSWALSSFDGFPGQSLPSAWTYGGFA